MSKNIFETVDYEGCPVHCTKSQWYGHIVTRHPELTKNIEGVKESIQNPSVVHVSNQNENCKVFFKSNSSHVTSYKNCIIKTVVSYSENDGTMCGEVKTVHFLKEIKGGIGDEIYRKPQD